MGNFWIAQFDSSSSSPSSTTPSSPAIAQSTINEGTHSGASSAFSSSMNEVSPNGQILPSTPNLRIFSFAELKTATRNFRHDTLLGEGGFGKVFKGWIHKKTFAPAKAGSGMAIAVKKLRSESIQGREEWQSEVNILGSLSHPNIVRLLGHCQEGKELLLVYEFMPRGSLANHLFNRGSSAFRPLSWSIRLKIAIGAARALAFLHCSERKIIYRGLKASDILLDSNYNAKISDFGLAMNGPQGENSHVSTSVKGFGHVAPEYVATGHLYVKSDVYLFGVVLLEMLSGMRALDTMLRNGQHSLVEWAKSYLSDQRKVLSQVMDQQLEGQYPSKGAVQAAQLILNCLRSDPRNRPSMTEVVETLEQIQAIKHIP